MEVRNVVRRAVPNAWLEWFQWKLALGRNSTRGRRIYEELRSKIDEEELRDYLARSRSELLDDPASSAKYYDHRAWLRKSIADAMKLGLDCDSDLKILDIGCGPGWFLYVASHLGHQCRGIDLPLDFMREKDRTAYSVIPDLLGCGDQIGYEPVKALSRLAVGGKYDLITCMLICFDGHWQENPWGVAEWKFFLDDMDRLLADGGRLFLQFNRKGRASDGCTYFDRPTRELLTSRGEFRREWEVVITKVGEV